MNICESIKKRYIRLSKGQRKVAQYVVDNPGIVATHVASEVGRLAGVSESTVIRFCYAMNLAGYSELQEKMKQYILEKDGVIPATTKNRAVKKQNIPFNEVIARDMKDLLTVMQQTNEKEFNNAIKLLHNAQQIFIVGFRDALPAAFSFYYELKQFRENVHFVQYDAAQIGADLVQMNDSSVLVILNNEQSQEDVYTVAQIAARKNVSIFTISNEPCEQLAKLSKMTYFLNNSGLMEDGRTALYAFIHALVRCLVTQHPTSYNKKDMMYNGQAILNLIS